MQLKQILWLAIPFLSVVGCVTSSSSIKYPYSVTHPDGIYEHEEGDFNAVQWVSCDDETNSELVMILELSRSNVVIDRNEFPIKRAFCFDVKGNLQVDALWAISLHSDGVSKDGLRGVGSSISYSFCNDNGWMSLTVNHSWTTDDGVRGTIEGDVLCAIGTTDEWALSDSVRLNMSYRIPSEESEQIGAR